MQMGHGFVYAVVDWLDTRNVRIREIDLGEKFFNHTYCALNWTWLTLASVLLQSTACNLHPKRTRAPLPFEPSCSRRLAVQRWLETLRGRAWLLARMGRGGKCFRPASGQTWRGAYCLRDPRIAASAGRAKRRNANKLLGKPSSRADAPSTCRPTTRHRSWMAFGVSSSPTLRVS